MNKKIFTLLIILIASFSLSARSRWMTGTYEMSFAAPRLHDFLDKPSFQGFGFNFYEGISDYFMVGGRFSWNNFFQKFERDSYSFLADGQGTTITAVQYKRVSSMAFMAEATFVARNSSILLPYLSVGIGPSWDSKEHVVGIWSTYYGTVHFIVRPEIGLIIPFNSVGVKIAGGYNGIVNNSDTGVDDIDNFTVGIGVAFGSF